MVCHGVRLKKLKSKIRRLAGPAASLAVASEALTRKRNLSSRKLVQHRKRTYQPDWQPYDRFSDPLKRRRKIYYQLIDETFLRPMFCLRREKKLSPTSRIPLESERAKESERAANVRGSDYASSFFIRGSDKEEADDVDDQNDCHKYLASMSAWIGDQNVSDRIHTCSDLSLWTPRPRPHPSSYSPTHTKRKCYFRETLEDLSRLCRRRAVQYSY